VIGFGWVIDGELAGMGQPGLVSPLEMDLVRLKKRGVGAVVSLTEQPLDATAVGASGLDVLHMPIRDMMAPSIGDIERFVDFVEAALGDDKPVAVHCFAGRGRTGTMLACFLVHRGADPAQAIEAVRVQRPGSIETDTQVVAVLEYAQHLLAHEGEGRDRIRLATRSLN